MPELPAVHNPRKTKYLRDREKTRRNQASRQYATNHTTWRKLRKYVLDREPLCRECGKAGKTTQATDVDHIDGDSFNNEIKNLQPLCRGCHSRKTVTEDGGFGNERQR